MNIVEIRDVITDQFKATGRFPLFSFKRARYSDSTKVWVSTAVSALCEYVAPATARIRLSWAANDEK